MRMDAKHDNPTPKKSFTKKIFKIVLVFIAIVVLGILSLLGLLFIYQDDVKAAVIAELNKHLKAEVKIAPTDIDLTIIKTFPDCSIQFNQVLMLEALPIAKRDTLLFAGQLNLHFNLMDLWHKKYTVQKAKLKNARVKLRVLKNGQVNYLFWEQDKPKKETKKDSLNFDLQLVELENCQVSYYNKRILFNTEFHIQSLDFKGNFNQSNFELTSNAKLFVNQLADKNTTYLKSKQLEFQIQLQVIEHQYSIKQANLRINQLGFDMSGGFEYNDSLKKLDINYKAPKLDIASALSLIPDKFKTDIKNYESTGNFYAQGSIRYDLKNAFSIASDFGIKNGEITYKPNATVAKNVNVDGYLNYNTSSSKASELSLKNLYLKLKNDEVKGNCVISNFSNPRIKLSAQANINLENLQSFLPIDTLSNLKGGLILSAEIEGLLDDLKKQTFSPSLKLELDAEVSNLEAQFKGDDYLFAVESCSLTAKDREVEVKNLKLKRGSSDVLLNGKLPEFFNYLSDAKAPLIISGNLFSNNLKLEDFMLKYTSSGGQGMPLIPANIQFKLNAAILKFSYAKFQAQNITGDIEIRNQKAIVSDMKLNTMDGEVVIDAFADNSKDKLEVVLQSNLKNINVSHLFFQFDNFGQSTLQDKNIKGIASANIEFSGTWSNKLEPNYASIQSVCNLNIERGELIDFKPLLSLSKFVDIQDLQRIKFSTLQSEVQIKNNTITFPKTTLKNSAINIDFFGTHTFNNEMDYHIQLLISDLLAKKRKNKDEEFGPIEQDKDNRRSAFILMTGTVDKPIIKYDKKGLKEKVKKDIQEEKQNIKQILKEEFGLFKKEANEKKKTEAEQRFELEKPNANPPKKTLEPKKKEEDEDF